MSMSLDGFIAGPNETDDNGLGDGRDRLHDWAFPAVDPDQRGPHVGRLADANGEVSAEMRSTGAVVAGRGTFEPSGGWGGDHHDGVPIWVYGGHEPGIDVSQWPLVTYVDDVRTAMTEAKRPPARRTCWSKAPQSRSSRSRPASSTSSRSISSRCSSARGAVCSRASIPHRSS